MLLLDADSTPMADVTELFEDRRYKATGSLFWPDYWKTPTDNPIFDIVAAPETLRYGSWEMESGQVVINKKCWAGFLKAFALCDLCASEFGEFGWPYDMF